MTVRLSLMIIVVFSGLQDLLAQQYQLVHYTKDKGLPGNQVWSIYQDSKGYMWFSTSAALVKYNGKDYKLYNKSTGLLEDFALNVNQDGKGDIWAGCPGGVSRIKKDKVDTWKIGKFDDFFNVFVDSYDRVWAYNFQFAGDFYVIEKDSLHNYSELYGLKNQRIEWIAEDREGAVHLLTKTGKIYKFSVRAMTELHLGDFLDQLRPRMFFFDSHGNMILCGNAGVARISFNGKAGRAEMEWLLKESAMFALESTNGYYWIATRDNGLFRLNPGRGGHSIKGEMLHITDQGGLTTNNLFTLYEDREQNIWIGTNLKGICRLSSMMFISFGRNEGFKEEAILAVAHNRGSLYCSTERGIYVFNHDRLTKLKIHKQGESSSADRFFLSMLPATDGTWILGSAPGLFRLGKSGQLETIGLSQLVVQTFLRDSAGGVWIGTNKGIYKLQENRAPSPQDFGLRNRYINRLLEVRKKDLYVATDSGLVIIEWDFVGRREIDSRYDNQRRPAFRYDQRHSNLAER
ncbi:MAG: putative hybrid sensor [Bacteroidetes bacterium]|nr:putative hybrid sensor [Bacteroidota bacterium]